MAGVDTAAVRDVILRDGTTLRLRPPHSDDVDGLLAFFRDLSEESLYTRFHGIPAIRPSLVRHDVDPDWVEHGTLVGTLGADGDERIVAVASYARLRDPGLAEVAFAVADDLQQRGVGMRLLEQLAERATQNGIEGFVAEVLPSNRAMLGVFRDAGFAETRERSGGVVEVRLDLEATSGYLARVDERDHVAVVASLRPFFAPGTVAVVGTDGDAGARLLRNVLAGDFTGAVHPVNPSARPVAGVRGHARIADIPGAVDLAIIAVPAAGVLDAAREALDAGVRALCVVTSGFAEAGAAGAQRQQELLSLVRSRGGRLIGPNCLGIASAPVRLNATIARQPIPPGRIGFSSQSSALGAAFLEEAAGRGMGLSAFVSIGNKADVSSNDLLEHWEDDEETGLIALYLESFGNPRRFGRVARRVARRKPILALKTGRPRTPTPGARAGSPASAHDTAALLFEQAGVIRTDTLPQLLDVAAVLSRQRLPHGRSVAVVTNAGGIGSLCADACAAAGLELTQPSDRTRRALRRLLSDEATIANPIDLLGSATALTYADALGRVVADPCFDAVIAVVAAAATAVQGDAAAAIQRAAVAAARRDKPLLAVVMGDPALQARLSRGAPPAIPVFGYPERAAAALGHAVRRAEWLRRPAGAVPDLEGIDARAARERLAGAGADPEGRLPAESVAELLGAVGVDVGAADLPADRPALLAGIVQDPTFGPLVILGAGGPLGSLAGDPQLRLAPLTDADAQEVVARAGPLIGDTPDAAAAVDLLHRLSRLAVETPELAELRLDPVVVVDGRCLATAAHARVAQAPAGPAKTW